MVGYQATDRRAKNRLLLSWDDRGSLSVISMFICLYLDTNTLSSNPLRSILHPLLWPSPLLDVYRPHREIYSWNSPHKATLCDVITIFKSVIITFPKWGTSGSTGRSWWAVRFLTLSMLQAPICPQAQIICECPPYASRHYPADRRLIAILRWQWHL